MRNEDFPVQSFSSSSNLGETPEILVSPEELTRRRIEAAYSGFKGILDRVEIAGKVYHRWRGAVESASHDALTIRAFNNAATEYLLELHRVVADGRAILGDLNQEEGKNFSTGTHELFKDIQQTVEGQLFFAEDLLERGEALMRLPDKKEDRQDALPRAGLFSRSLGTTKSLLRRAGRGIERFVHGDSLEVNRIMSSAKLDRTPREPAYPEQETSAENSAARSGEETQEIVQPVPQPEAPSDPVVTESAPVTEEIQSGPGFSSAEPEAPTPSEESAIAPSVEAREETVPEQPVSPSSFVERVVAQAGASVGSAESVEVRKTPEEIAFDTAVDFTAKVEKFIAGMSPLDYSKGYEAFTATMNELLTPPSEVNPADFALTQDRIMYRIARDASFPKEARELLVQLLEKRGAVKVEDRGDGKKVIRRLVSYGETAQEVIRDAKTPERRAARAEFARKQEEI